MNAPPAVMFLKLRDHCWWCCAQLYGPPCGKLVENGRGVFLDLSCYPHGEYSSDPVGPKSDRANQDSNRGSTVTSMVRRLKLFIH
jgi:hypothetical protein